jgi:dTDP-4-dehydrorhamnose reductase
MSDVILLTGVDGYVGSRLAAPLAARADVIGVSRRPGSSTSCDLTDPAAVASLAVRVSPAAIVHAAGTKDIRACAQHPTLAFDANVRTTLNLLDAFPGVPFLYISTDYVFAGDRGLYTEDDAPQPRTTYGQSKLSAEQVGRLRAPDEFCSVRVSALYDGEATFLRFLRDTLTAGTPVDCYEDAHYSPTSLPDFVTAIGQLLDAGATRPTVVHVAGPRISRYAFACAYAAAFGHDPHLVVPTRLGPGPVPLFPDLSLDTTLARSALDFHPRSHEDALDALAERRLA